MDELEQALELRLVIEQNASLLPDEQAIKSIDLFPNWGYGEDVSYKKGKRYRFNRHLYKCLQDYDWTDYKNPPIFNPELWQILDPVEVTTWDMNKIYQRGERVSYDGGLYENAFENHNAIPGNEGSSGWYKIN